MSAHRICDACGRPYFNRAAHRCICEERPRSLFAAGRKAARRSTGNATARRCLNGHAVIVPTLELETEPNEAGSYSADAYTLVPLCPTCGADYEETTR